MTIERPIYFVSSEVARRLAQILRRADNCTSWRVKWAIGDALYDDIPSERLRTIGSESIRSAIASSGIGDKF